MSPRWRPLRGDPAQLVLRLAVRLLPESRRDWGEAMRAELAHLPAGRARVTFALGCLRASALAPHALRGAGYPALGMLAVAAGVVGSGGIAYAPARVAVLVVLALLAGIALLGRTSWLFGPVSRDLAHRSARVLALVVVAASAAQLVVELRSWANNNPESMVVYVGVAGTVLAWEAIGVVLLTGSRARVAGSAVGAGLGLGFLAAAAWVALAERSATMPASGVGAIALIVLASGAAATVVARRTHDGRQCLIALAAAALAGLSLAFSAALGMIHLQPERIPDIVGPFMLPTATAAQRLAEDSIEIVDGYVALLLLGGISAVGLVAAIVKGRDRRCTDLPDAREPSQVQQVAAVD